KSMRPMLIKLRHFKIPMVVVCLLSLAIIVLLPLVIIFLVGFLKAYGLPLKLENMTFNNYHHVLLVSKMARDAMKNSVVLSISAAIITMFVGTMVAYVIVKIKPKGKGILEVLGLLPY
ncbi:MAG TPA: iron ABC transporter permease, partial [Firmicutes bacterium]|nr:iron ABC transporter permease [Bacillota bacterium]